MSNLENPKKIAKILEKLSTPLMPKNISIEYRKSGKITSLNLRKDNISYPWIKKSICTWTNNMKGRKSLINLINYLNELKGEVRQLEIISYYNHIVQDPTGNYNLFGVNFHIDNGNMSTTKSETFILFSSGRIRKYSEFNIKTFDLRNKYNYEEITQHMLHWTIGKSKPF